MTDTADSPLLPVVVIGAGPVGLAAAAQLSERGLLFTVLEAGDEVGASVRSWGHVRVFSPWRFDIDPAARRLLEAAGWSGPDPDALPTGAELVERYLVPLAALPAIAPNLRLGARVQAISRVGFDRVHSKGREDAPFLVRLVDTSGRAGEVRARAVIDASGTWSSPNVLGASGLPAYGEKQAAAWIESALPDVLGKDRERFAGKRTLVVGTGHSAANTLLALAELAEAQPGTKVSWALRGASPVRVYGGEDADALPARGALGSRLRALVESGRISLLTGFGIDTIAPLGASPQTAGVRVDAHGGGRRVEVDRIVAATGFRPDHSITSELRLDLDPILGSTRALAPLIDPNEHSCGTVPPHGQAELAHPEAGYYAVGMKSYGRAPTFLMATGYEQVRSVVAALAGDWEAAREVRLELPKTGVCSTGLPGAEAGGGCGSSCAAPEPVTIGLPVSRGLATGVAGGLLSAPLVMAGGDGSGCCES